MKDMFTKKRDMMFNYYIFCDGAGTTQSKPAGCSAEIHDDKNNLLINLLCSTSHGTNNFAELLPIVQSLWWLGYNKKLESGTRIKITSDSEVTVKGGTGEYQRGYQNEILWMGIQGMIDKYKLEIEWTHVPRNSTDVMTRMDVLAKEQRCIYK